jgi:hypothetical protein
MGDIPAQIVWVRHMEGGINVFVPGAIDIADRCFM